MNIHDLIVTDIKDNKKSLSLYKGKVMLIVNTATKCGFTPQLKGLEELHEKYSEKGLAVLGFPCNQFLEQAPESSAKIQEFCRIYYGTEFDMFAKVNVKGKDIHPLFKFLTDNSPDEIENSESKGFLAKLAELAQIFTGKEIKWNFTKFLIDREGNIVARFSPTVKPEEIAAHIEKLL
ncbi:MAG: glutathione peroxidase [Candidatus Riflebacteria bacterium]|nr:glutathione peroxidase [Candidatus Riflebacteria bacterium]NLV95007.1 glutathione peroxidase [Candidatus Riflebacteria bacterium]